MHFNRKIESHAYQGLKGLKMKIGKECLELLEAIEEYCPNDREKCEKEVGRIKSVCIVQKFKRKPSAYNIFMRECLLSKRNEKKEHKQKFKECVLNWKQK